MNGTDPTVRIPADALAALADRCAHLGDAGLEAVRESGRIAGHAILRRLDLEAEPGDAPAGEFWSAVRAELEDLGFGDLSYDVLSPGVAAVTLHDPPEANASAGAPRSGAGCPFATGLLGGLLSEVAGDGVAILEAECQVAGDAACRFLVGAESRLEEVHGHLADGLPVTEAVEAV